MRVELKTLQDNPMRDFKVDPIDDEVVENLKQSIKNNPAGLWPGILARRTKHNGIQLVFGHHRVRAAIKAGIRESDNISVVAGIDDADMTRMYASENATQRGNSGTALAGSVAAATRFLARAILTGAGVSEKIFRNPLELDQARGNLTSDRGIGRDIVARFLGEIPGLNDGVIQQQLANLKASGDYARIIGEIQQEIERENREALKALARAEAEQKKLQAEREAAEARQREAAERRKEAAKAERAAKEEADRKRAAAEAQRAELAQQKAEAEAALAKKRQAEADKELAKFDALRETRDTGRKAVEKSEGRDVTFDFEGVARHLRNASHIDTFRQLVTGPGIKPYLPVNKQEALAKKLVALAGDSELSARFIRENVMSMVMEVKGGERKLDAQEKATLLRKDWEAKARGYQEDFARNARGLLSAGVDLAEHEAKRPKGVTFQVTQEFRTAVANVERAVVRIRKAGIL